MTITANDRRKAYQGNGVATDFTGPRAFSASHLQVFVGTDPNYALIPSSQYTVTGVGVASSQTVIKFNTAPAANADILILRLVPYDQPTDITNQGRFLPELHEGAFDYRVMQIQQLADGSLVLVLDPDSGQFVWDAKGMRIVRVGDGIAEQDAVNMRTLYTYVEQIQNGGGSVGVAPRSWSWLGDGTTVDFPIPGADVGNSLFYDSAMERTAGAADYRVLRPEEDFTVVVGADTTESILRFAVAPAAGLHGFTVLRGYARPYTGPSPITTTAPRIITGIEGDTIVDGSFQNSLIIIDTSVDVVLTVRANTGAANDWRDGEYFSVLQLGVGKVKLAVQAPGTLLPSPGFVAETRGLGSIISATCMQASGGRWAVSGDLLRPAVSGDVQCFDLPDATALIGTNIDAGTGKASFVMPYGFELLPVAEGGIYASVVVAQTAGVPLTVDVNRNGTSILSTKLTFDNNERTTRLAATPPVYASGSAVLFVGDEVTVDVDQIGTAGAKGLRVYLVGKRVL
ncbi:MULTISPECIES: hypothetical protein [unclassified Xanthomonas]|uniref:hypothetical protein n=1 Tax=unclassified Xanthomonas TaxID=2643310 RepID=UPI002A83C513|nr:MULTISPECIES: hypothetical protein [unclassified Xanthomonas]MDY4297510.1 hypothetical protein [Xanthomonas sp. LF02-5]MDY4359304.1 hypothetical protein [Xanthomonas sp. LF04-12]